MVLISNLWTWTTVASKVVNFVNYKIKDYLYKEILMRKKWNDVNWLPTFKKHSQFESCGIENKFKIKFYWIIILKFQESFTTCKWGVMYMTSKGKL